MKKLMTTMLAVAVGVGLHAAGMADTGTSFEGLDAGAYDITATTGELSAQEAGQTYWVTNGTETLTVVDGVSVSAEYYNPGSPSRPAGFSGAQTRYLAVKTTLGNPVTRNVSVGGEGTSIGSGFYFDSLVKFTAFEGDQQVDLNGGKLAIWLQENLDDGTQEPVSTNLVVTAGYLLNEGVVATNYVCTLAGIDLSDGGWHRVTVKAIESIYGTDTVPGFVVFVDGVYATSTAAKGIEVSSLTDNAYAFNSDGALFPSAVQSGADKAKVAAVSFDGQGDVDDLIFTETAPAFAKDNEFFTIELGANVASLTYSVYGMGLPVTITETTRLAYVPDMGVTVTGVTYANGYMSDGISMSASVTLTDGYYFPGAAEQSITANAKVAGAAINGTPYETAAAAFAAISAGEAGVGPFTVTLNSAATSGVELDEASAEVVLDLAGNNITAGELDAAAITLIDGTLLITNSTVTVGEVNGYDGGNALVTVSGALTIAGGIYNGAVDVSGATSLITGGSFSVNDNKDPDSETLPPAPNADLAAAVMTGFALEVVSQSSYYTLVEVVAPSIWTVTFLNDGDTYATVEVEDGQVCVLPDAPTKEHYTFAGWYPYNIGALQPYDFTQPITADVTVEARYTADTYTVSFNAAGGSTQPENQLVAYLDYATEPQGAPAKDYYTFQFWSEDGSTEFDFENTAIVSNTTLTAIYTPDTYTITYMYGESELTSLTPAIYTVEDAVTLPSEVDLGVVGVSFEAWTNAEGQVVASWAAGAKNGNQTFYAQVSAVTPPTKYEPGEEGITPPAGKTAAQFAEEINENKAAYIDAPSTTDVANTANYLALFHAVADTEAGTVSIELTTGAYEIEQIAANATATAIASNFAAETVQITAQPGLWYSISSGSTLTGMTEGTRVMATDSNLSEGKLTLTLPETTGTGFYKVNVNLADKPAPVPNP